MVRKLHAGVLCDATDTAMRTAYSSTLSEGETFTTLELKINFTKSVWNARLRMIGQAIKQGSTNGWSLN
ncbi:hotdog domain-containing protein [Neobacillus sp. B4I6]|uniref:hotdog domain-containing protein n=1 Tax=Neobacillus sp. B4I6 TaxID=3373925 RepID=UPI003D21D88D